MADQTLLQGLLARRSFLQALGISGLSAAVCLAQQPGRQDLKEPVFRVSKNNPPVPVAAKAASHPLDPALELARPARVPSINT